jgi:uncharacterized MAPEG superfamily protein
MNSLSPELRYTAMTAALAGSLWIPIIVNRLREMGVWKALKNPEPDVRPQAAWAYRLANAHRNAIENLVVFAPLALCVSLPGLGTATTASAAALFFWSRVAHALIYTFGVPLLRTVAFVLGFGAQATMGLRIFGVI